MEKNLVRDSFVEGFGTFILVLLGAGAGALLPESPTKLLMVALAHGLAIVIVAYTYGHFSGGNINPAVTLGLLTAGIIKLPRAIAYWVAQFIGAALAAAFIKLMIIPAITPAIIGLGETTGSLTATALPNALAIEFLLTFLLASIVIQAGAYGKAGTTAGLAIGLTLVACILFGGTLTGASLNPARTFGPALIQGTLFGNYAIAYIVAILLGGAAAGFIHSSFLAPHVEPVKSSKR